MKHWTRKQWAVFYDGNVKNAKGETVNRCLCTTLWAGCVSQYEGEPSQILMFTTRIAALKWKQQKGYPELRVVRVRETVTVL